MKKAVLFLFMMLIITACGGGGGEATNSPTTSGDKLLVWVGEGPSPDQRVGNSTGQLAYLTTDGTLTPLIDLSAEVIGVSPCGTEATSPDGQYFAFYVNAPREGADSGTIYQISGGGQPVVVSEGVQAMSCLGNGTFQYSPDSKRLGYLNYNNPGPRDEYSSGTLNIHDTASAASQVTIENTAGFYLANDRAYAIRFFPNDNGQVDEAALAVWNGSETSEVAAFYPESGCRFNNIQLAPTTDNRLAAMFGQRCGASSLSWQFYTINLGDNSATMALNNSIGTSFFPYTRTNNVIPAAGGGSILYTLPDGLTANTVGIQRVDISTLTPQALIERGAVMPRYDARTFSLPANASAIFSRDGRWWATVVIEGVPTVKVIDVSNPAAALIESPAPARTDTIPFMGFSPDGNSLYYVAGSTGGGENTLFRIDLTSGSVQQIGRGQYGPGAVAPDGQSVALTQWLRAEDTRQTPYTNLALVKGDNSATTMFTGVELGADGSVANRRFAHPLTWRR